MTDLSGMGLGLKDEAVIVVATSSSGFCKYLPAAVNCRLRHLKIDRTSDFELHVHYMILRTLAMIVK